MVSGSTPLPNPDLFVFQRVPLENNNEKPLFKAASLRRDDKDTGTQEENTFQHRPPCIYLGTTL